MRYTFSIFLIVCLFLAEFSIAGEALAKYVISGKVIDGESQEGLPFAHVFLSGTTYGVATDMEGQFSFEVKEAGTYELMVRFIGFESYAQVIRVDKSNEPVLTITLKPKTDFLEAVEVVAGKQRNRQELPDGRIIVTGGFLWKQYYRMFLANFLGMSPFTDDTKILNADAIEFTIDGANNRFTASTTAPLKIMNKGLGYELTYFLENFEADFNDQSASYHGYPLFKELEPRSRRQARRWDKNRERAYVGSSRQFFRALYNNRLRRSKFVTRNYAPSQRPMRASADPELIGGFRKLSEKINMSRLIGKADDFGVKTFRPAHTVVVTGTWEIEDDEYVRPPEFRYIFGDDDFKKGDINYQHSWFKLNKPDTGIRIAENGYVFNPLDFRVEGYWVYEKVAALLPFDYQSKFEKE